MQRADSLGKTLMLGKIEGREGLGAGEKGTTEDEMAGWHQGLDKCESEWTLGVGDGQGGLACCGSWGRKESNTTEWLNWTESKQKEIRFILTSLSHWIEPYLKPNLQLDFSVMMSQYMPFSWSNLVSYIHNPNVTNLENPHLWLNETMWDNTHTHTHTHTQKEHLVSTQWRSHNTQCVRHVENTQYVRHALKVIV